MEVKKTGISDLLLLKPLILGDSRGYFTESYNAKTMHELGLPFEFVQDNQSFSKYGTLRGLHFQQAEFAQTKLVRVTHGKILDVAVDLRTGSNTFGKHYAAELSEDNFEQLLIPKGFAHGFVVLSENAIVQYKCDTYYSPENESGIHYNDPDLNIDWQVPEDSLILSDKDRALPMFKECAPQ